jgi:hypothetical protein
MLRKINPIEILDMKHSQLFRTSLLSLLLLTSVSSFAQDEKENVLTVVREFFDSIERSDSVKFKAVFLPEARFHIARAEGGAAKYATRPAIQSFFKTGTKFSERMRTKGVKVEVHQQMAMAWVPYDFYVNGNFTHCGFDAFTFLKIEGVWKISSLSFSVEKDGCTTW